MIKVTVKCTAFNCKEGKITRNFDKEIIPCVVCDGTGFIDRWFAFLIDEDVNYGDHGETHTSAIANLDPTLTVEELIRAFFPLGSYDSKNTISLTIVPATPYHQSLIKE